jgi:tetratricopeptide (TPR) repeat protein
VAESDIVMGTFSALLLASLIAANPLSGQETSAPATGAFEQARALIEAHQLQKANELLSELVRQDPANESVLIELGKVQLAQGLNDDALLSFEAVLKHTPISAAARDGEVRAATSAALADRKAGANDTALVYLVRARKFVPDSPELLLDFGVQAESMRIFSDADAALTKAHQLAPDDTKILYALARVELDEQKMPEAEANLRSYLKVRADDATAYYGLGRLLHMLLRYDEAKVELQQSIALRPVQSGSYYELGEIALEQNDMNEAKSEYEKVLGFAPHHGGALTGMGILAYRAKDYAAAEGYLKSAIFYASDYSEAHHYYALVLARLGRRDESKREADIATSLNELQTRTSRGNFLTVLP